MKMVYLAFDEVFVHARTIAAHRINHLREDYYAK